MNWNLQMLTEIKKAGLDIELHKVLKQRRANPKEVEVLQQRIKDMISENDFMRILSNHRKRG